MDFKEWKKNIIISAVRSNEEGNIGFLTSKKRLNVALTRAKKGLIILGNSKCLSKRAGLWRDLIDFYYSKKLIVKGHISDFDFVKKEEILSKPLINIKDNERNMERKEKKYYKSIKLNNNNYNEQPAPPIKSIVKENIIDNNIINNKNNNNVINNNKNEMKKEQKNEQKNIEKAKINKNKKKHIIKEVEKEKGNKKYQNKMKSKKNRNKKDKEEDKKDEENEKDIINENIKDKKDKKKNIKIKDEKIKEKKSKKQK